MLSDTVEDEFSTSTLCLRFPKIRVIVNNQRLMVMGLNLCISSHLRIVNGDDKHNGSFTCFARRGCSTVNYTLTCISSDFFNVVDFYIGELSEYSDHCPLSLVLRLPIPTSVEDKQTIYNVSTSSDQALLQVKSEKGFSEH